MILKINVLNMSQFQSVSFFVETLRLKQTYPGENHYELKTLLRDAIF